MKQLSLVVACFDAWLLTSLRSSQLPKCGNYSLSFHSAMASMFDRAGIDKGFEYQVGKLTRPPLPLPLPLVQRRAGRKLCIAIHADGRIEVCKAFRHFSDRCP